jgi:hypothetical protein
MLLGDCRPRVPDKKTSIITITYSISLISDFQQIIHEALKTQLKVRGSSPFVGIFVGIGGSNVHREFRGN